MGSGCNLRTRARRFGVSGTSRFHPYDTFRVETACLLRQLNLQVQHKMQDVLSLDKTRYAFSGHQRTEHVAPMIAEAFSYSRSARHTPRMKLPRISTVEFHDVWIRSMHVAGEGPGQHTTHRDLCARIASFELTADAADACADFLARHTVPRLVCFERIVS